MSTGPAVIPATENTIDRDADNAPLRKTPHSPVDQCPALQINRSDRAAADAVRALGSWSPRQVPELPEVEYVRRQLCAVMEGARIERVLARRPDLRYPLGTDFAARLEGHSVRALRRRAKYLIAELSSGDILVMHLGMSGWFHVIDRVPASALTPRRGLGEPSPGVLFYDPRRLTAHDHIVFEMSSGAAVVFNDPRRFGFMKILSPNTFASDPTLSGLGPEPLDRTFNAVALAKALQMRKTSLKVALSDQRIVAGLGNIYVCEALHRAGLSPKRRASTLVSRSGVPRGDAKELADAIKAVLRDAIANQHRADGEDRFRVYDREGSRCPRRGCSGTIKRIVQAGRSTFFCPTCQR